MKGERGRRANPPESLLKDRRCGSSGMVGFGLFTRFGLYQESIVGGDYGIARGSEPTSPNTGQEHSLYSPMTAKHMETSALSLTRPFAHQHYNSVDKY